jgi:hypothetical protein
MSIVLKITPNARPQRNQAIVDAFLAEQGAVSRKIETVKDVVLVNGTVLPNRRLMREVFDLADGRTVEVKSLIAYDGPSNNNYFGLVVIEVDR